MDLFRMLAEALGWSKKKCRIIVVGLDNSGKTTVVNHLKPRKVASYEVVPTVGFSEEVFEKGNLRFQAFDMSGAGTYRTLWESYYRDVNAIIFVIDSSDKIRMCVAKDELDGMLAHPDLKGVRVPILFYANKMDLPSACEPADVMALLGLAAIHDKPWHIQASNALSGEGVDDGITWLAEQLSKPGALTPAGKAASSAGGGATAGAGVPAGSGTSAASGATGGKR